MNSHRGEYVKSHTDADHSPTLHVSLRGVQGQEPVVRRSARHMQV
jgi:hypothetical protein